jgi:PKD repeat protein
VPQWPAADAESHARADDPLIANAGVGPVAFADRGALEYRPAQLTLTPASGKAPLAVTASAAGSVGPDGTAASFRFDFGDGTVVGPQAGATATHTYAAGNWNATVTVLDQSGGASSASASVAVNAPPTAALTAIPNHGSAPLTVTLNASASADADGQIVSYQFNFGDGLTGASQSSPIATHSYGTGTWAPIVTVTDNRGATAVASSPSAILVGAPNVPPVARASVTPTSGTAPLAVAVDASQSSDADGVIASYRFDFGDGQFAGPQPAPTASHTYPAGTWPLTVTVTDEDGGTSSTTVLITSIADLGRAPLVVAPASVSIAEGSPLTVTIHAADPDGQPITSLTASLAALPVGSGAVFTPGPGDSTATLTWTPGYAHAGSYPVSFTAANALSGSASTMITVQNVDRAPLVVAPGGVRANPDEPLTVHVSAADPDGEAITALTADLSSVPAGNAAFVAVPGDTAGTLTWTPALADSGRYTVTFTAVNARSGAAACVITVGGSDHPPVVSVPASVAAAEGSPLSLVVQVRDIDGDAILSLTANLAGLPAGNNATFTPGPGDTTGTLTWTPSFDDAGSYPVTFRASNADSGTATTMINVANVDRAPAVVAPATAIVHAGTLITVHVTAADADGQAITSLSADLSGLPAGHNAVFTPGAGNTTGTLTWTPAAGALGKYTVTFTAANALPGLGVTSITVTPPNQAPTAALTATPATGNEPLTVVADASGSTDGDGTIVSYRFDFGDGTVVGPQAGATASHTYAAGNWNLSLIVTDELGAVGGATIPVIAAAVGAGPNLVGNPSFEVNTNGWSPFPGSTMQRVAGGFDKSFALAVTGPDTLGTFGLNDSPNWVTTTPAAGTRYRISAWVRSAGSGGQARLRVREYQGLVRIGATGYFSNIVGLAPGWKLLTLDYVSQLGGTTLDLQVEDTPIAPHETFLVDNVSIRIVTGAAPARAGGVLTELMGARTAFRPTLTPNPMRAGGVIGFSTSRAGVLQADLFDASGRRVRRLMSRAESAGGWHEMTVDGRDEGGAPLAAGVYFYRIVSVDGAANGRFVLLR